MQQNITLNNTSSNITAGSTFPIRRLGKRSWQFAQPPKIVAGAAVCGPKEGQGSMAADMDYIFPTLRWGKLSFEQCEQAMQEKAIRLALHKADLRPADIDIHFGGDLINQTTPSSFTARELGAPYFGLFTACATSMEALSLAALSVAAGAATTAIAVSSSHTCTAERQFRYPNEYGSQKPPYSQQTVSAAGAAIVQPATSPLQARALISGVTVGRVRDEKVCDPFQMGAAMAPAFADTLLAHLEENCLQVQDYDLILSGDLGRDGSAIAQDLLRQRGVELPLGLVKDCGRMIFGKDESVFAGGSGAGCAAAVSFGHLLNLMQRTNLQRVLVCATGALLSPVSVQQKESIPAICHAVALQAAPAEEKEAAITREAANFVDAASYLNALNRSTAASNCEDEDSEERENREGASRRE